MIKIEDFSLAWCWISSSYGDFSKDTLNKLIPLNEDQARALIATTPINFPVGAKRFDSTQGSELTRQWLKGLVNDSQTVTICWDQETALTLPWLVFLITMRFLSLTQVQCNELKHLALASIATW
ncbi:MULTISPECIES: hypothetical protein [unclassified Pseudoalteromonas]|uniref:hypothetical protein n=1 Tax=unclassified Pseudoalteromonas TaxID=194690 RepID=UPI0021759DA5|nr:MULTISPECIES: hypothetical protein [unclassified Pseudoalteromonas]